MATGFLGVRVAAAALVAATTISGSSVAQTIRVLTFDVPPFSTARPDSSGSRGIYVDVMEAVLRDLGVKANIEFVGNADGQRIAQSSANVVFFPLARNAEREDGYQWIDIALEQELGFVTLAEKGPIANLADGRKVKRLGAIEGSSALRYIEERGFDNIVPGSPDDLVAMLVRGEIDAYFSGFLILRNVAKEQGIRADFAFGYAPVVGKPFFAAGKNAPAIDVERWRASFAKLRADGTIERIKERYFGK